MRHPHLGAKSSHSCSDGVGSTDDFSWQAQLRHGWSDVTDEIIVSQVHLCCNFLSFCKCRWKREQK